MIAAINSACIKPLASKPVMCVSVYLDANVITDEKIIAALIIRSAFFLDNNATVNALHPIPFSNPDRQARCVPITMAMPESACIAYAKITASEDVFRLSSPA